MIAIAIYLNVFVHRIAKKAGVNATRGTVTIQFTPFAIAIVQKKSRCECSINVCIVCVGNTRSIGGYSPFMLHSHWLFQNDCDCESHELGCIVPYGCIHTSFLRFCVQTHLDKSQSFRKKCWCELTFTALLICAVLSAAGTHVMHSSMTWHITWNFMSYTNEFSLNWKLGYLTNLLN